MLRWVLAGRYEHLVTATEGIEGRLPATVATRVGRRRKAIRYWVRIRGGVLALLYLNVGATVGTLLLGSIPALEGALGVLYSIARVTGAFAGVLAVTVLLLNRTLGQLEIDLLTTLLLHLETQVEEHPRGATYTSVQSTLPEDSTI